MLSTASRDRSPVPPSDSTKGAEAQTDTGSEPRPLDVHDEYRRATGWMFQDRAVVQLDTYNANKLAAGLASIAGIHAVLLAETLGQFTLSDHIKGGLLTAADRLTMECLGDLERGDKTVKAAA